ncbi:SAM-dependent methyltransferase [Fusarium oxysporum]|nr:SAM-dependent methyltransferase [Fusarium oxysporum]
MEQKNFTKARYAAMIWNAPLSETRAAELLDHLQLFDGCTVIDLGCGWGEILLRAVSRNREKITAVGIDTDAAHLERARALAEDRGLNVEFNQQPASEYTGLANRAICIGSSHALGGSKAIVLVGDMIWNQSPTNAALELFGKTGWEVLNLGVADQREWDDFESKHRAGQRALILESPESPFGQQLREELAKRERDYLTVYRGLLGFAFLVLGR